MLHSNQHRNSPNDYEQSRKHTCKIAVDIPPTAIAHDVLKSGKFMVETLDVNVTRMRW